MKISENQLFAMINPQYDGGSRWRWAVPRAFQGTLQFLWMWTEWRKDKVRRARAKVALKARTKVKVIRKVRLLERKVQTVAKVMVINSLGVRGSRQTSWQSSSWNAAGDNSGKGGKSGKSGKGKDGSKSKDFTCHKCGKPGHFARDAGCGLLDRMRTQQGKLVINPMQETLQQVAM